MRVLLTGGRGFIGHHLAGMLHRYRHEVFIADNRQLPASVNDPPQGVTEVWDGPLEGPDTPRQMVKLLDKYDITHVVHAAAHSHVDVSIDDPATAMANVQTTINMLEASRVYGKLERFLYVSTDEVYGDLDGQVAATESAKIRPGNPYAASKSASESYCFSYRQTFGMDVVVSRACNTFGPKQTPDKFVPRMIVQALRNQPLTLYGDGKQRREWMDVTSHCRAIKLLLSFDRHLIDSVWELPVVNLTGLWPRSDRSRLNVEIAASILNLLDRPMELIQYVEDRPGHDREYRMDGGRWLSVASPQPLKPSPGFEPYLRQLVHWYAGQAGQAWLKAIDADRFLVRRGLGPQEGNGCSEALTVTKTSLDPCELSQTLAEN